LLTRLLKRRTFGLEPSDLAELVRERDAVLFGVSDGVIALDDAGIVTMHNDEAVRLVGMEIPPGSDLLAMELPESLRRAVGDAAGHRAVATVGDRVLVVTRRAVEHEGRPLGSVITLIDRTEVETLTGELHGVRLMTQALRAQRHEFANRLHTVRGLLHTSGADDTAEYVDALLDAPDVLIADDSTAIAPATIRAFLSGKVAEAAELGVTLRLSEDSYVSRKLAIPVEVVTVLGNLVNNALEAARDSGDCPGLVEIDLLVDGEDLIVSVANTGAGIPPTMAGSVFEGGFSSHGADRGLGLAIARSTARGLGGDLELTHPGGNGDLTVFVARLPQAFRPGEAGGSGAVGDVGDAGPEPSTW
jgi:two-component system CitB family sensor kinase